MTGQKFKIVAQGFQFCEAPRADESGAVMFSDLTGGGYYRAAPDGAVETVLADRIWIGGATRDRGDAVLLGGKGGLVLVENGAVRPILEEIEGKPVVAVNDIEADAAGGIYGGTLDFDAVFERGELPSGGILFHLTPAGELTILRDDVVASNGFGFSPDGSTLYHSESTRGIWAWDLRGGKAVGAPAMFAEADDCDGLVVDSDGCVWVAFWREAVIRRYRPDATVERVVRLPFPSLVSLSFGGPDLCDLFVTTGSSADFPAAGGVVCVRTDVPGQAENRSAFARN